MQFIRRTLLSVQQKGIFHSFLISILFLLISLPFVVILFHLFQSSENSEFLKSFLHSDMIYNSVFLVITIVLLSLVLGVSTAWLISQYDFKGKRFLEWALILPITIPTYIMAFTYVGILNNTGTLQGFLKNNFSNETAEIFRFDVITPLWLVLFLSLSLYPYVYLSAKIAFVRQSGSAIEAARSLGASKWKVFLKTGLPLAWPAIVGGSLLVAMEVLNDYGAMAFFGIPTFTTAITHAWQIDLKSALILSSYLFIFIFLLVNLEKLIRGKRNFSEANRNRPFKPEKLKGKKSFFILLICSIPFLLGFLVPFLQLISWCIQTYTKVIDEKFLKMAFNSFNLAFLAALLTTIIALILAHFYSSGKKSFISNTFITIGYAIPGAIIAVGIMLPAGYIGNTFNLLLIGTISLMIYAFIIRFLAVAYNPIESAFEKNAKSLQESSRSLGKNKWFTLLRIELPVIKAAILSAIILVFVDVLKELPLTMILRPFDFPTLATNAFTYAKINESIMQSSNAALIIIFIGIIPVFILHRIIKK